MTAVLPAAQSNDRRAALVALRDTLAEAIDLAEPQVVAQLAGQLRQVLAEIDSLPAAGVKSLTDELKEKRAARRAAAKAATTASG
jgi:hypothetical protein